MNSQGPRYESPSHISAVSKNIVVPVTADATHSIGPILVAFIIVGILIGVALYLYTNNHHNEYDQGGGYMAVSISNKAKVPYNVSLPNGSNVELSPDQETNVSVSQHDTVSATSYNYDGTPVTHNFKISNPQIKKIHITPSGFRSDVSGAENVVFVNNAPYPVMFIEQSSKGGRRWASDIVPPNSNTGGHFVGKRTTWQVAHPTDENNPITQITVGSKADKLVFDGETLKSY